MMSDKKIINGDVPEGSVFVPLLYLLYRNKMQQAGPQKKNIKLLQMIQSL